MRDHDESPPPVVDLRAARAAKPRVRLAHPGDAAALAAFAAHPAERRSVAQLERHEQRVRQLVEREERCLVVAEIDGVVVGFADAQNLGRTIRRDWAVVRMHELWVAPDARRRGAGAALFDEIRRWAESTGARVLEWKAPESGRAFLDALGIAEAIEDPGYRLEFDGGR